MINTVLGQIAAEHLGITLMHEHIIWNWQDTKGAKSYTVEEVADTMLPYLLDLKQFGCKTLVDATPYGAGRDIDVLKACAKKSGLNIITNVGAWDGGDYRGRLVPDSVKEIALDDLVEVWCDEYFKGIDGTEVRPGFIKVALGDEGCINELQEKLLRAAARTSIKTGLPVQCHSFTVGSAFEAVRIVEEEKLSYDKFIWVHADGEENLDAVRQIAEKGIWVELDCLARRDSFDWYIDAIKELDEAGLGHRVLISQDAGMYYVGGQNDEGSILPYSRLFREFVPVCREKGVSEKVLDRILVENPAVVLDVVY